MICEDYRRHHARQRDSLRKALSLLREKIGSHPFHLVLTGSGAEPLAKELGVPFLQEVVASAIVLRSEFPRTRTAIELGGQDAKILFFVDDKATGQKQVQDMRMNGICAGGTGAFLDEVSEILRIPVEEYNATADRGEKVYDISGRCGVFAKTDLQPLLHQGADKADLALSAYHAIAKQTIGGLARGMQIHPPVAFLGGVLTYHPRLIQVFAERLPLQPEEILIPEHPETCVARGAAFSCLEMFSEEPPVAVDAMLQKLSDAEEKDQKQSSGPLYFRDDAEKAEFLARHPHPKTQVRALPEPGECVRGYLGIDAGSTTTKFVFMDEEGEIRWSHYGNNGGDPLKTAAKALIEMREAFRARGASLEILQAASTGYGEVLFSKAFRTDTHLVETVAHATAAAHYAEDVSFLLDIGGQDMKGIWLDGGVITDIVINEACSSGCGSFLENFASSLHISREEIANAAFSSESPAVLGSRCTVFMNSSIITEQRNGSTPADIMAGLCRSIIENVFVKVIRVPSPDALGDRIMVQGGTFLNDAVLRAIEQYVGRDVLRAPYPGLMGAIGAALEAKEYRTRRAGDLRAAEDAAGDLRAAEDAAGDLRAAEDAAGDNTGDMRTAAPSDGRPDSAAAPSSRFLSLDSLDSFSYTQESGVSCPHCNNHCQRTVMHFSSGDTWVTGNRCERGEMLGDQKESDAQSFVQKAPDLFRLRQQLLFRDQEVTEICPARKRTIGIPRVLFYWDSYPFWNAFWRSLGFSVLLSPQTTRKIYEDGLPAVTSDTECFPAKVVHGHLRWLEDHGVDRIFFPSITAIPSENTEKTSESMCSLVKGYPLVIRNSDDPLHRRGIPLDAPLFHWHTEKDRRVQLQRFMKERFGISEKETAQAIRQGDLAQKGFRTKLMEAGQQVLDSLTGDDFAVVLASRPYQNDPLINHELPRMFTELGIPVVTADSLREIYDLDLSRLRLDAVNNYHSRMTGSAILAATSDRLEYVQVVSFGCGHDAYLSDEIVRIMREISHKTPLALKVDESDAVGPLRLRVRSFIETVRRRRRQNRQEMAAGPGNGSDTSARTAHGGQGSGLPDPYPVKFRKEDKKIRTILIPNTSHAFSRLMATVIAGQGVETAALPVGRENAIKLGKRYVHNDICFPAQIVIGEALDALKSGRYDPDHTAIGMAKYIGDCRLTHYSALLRKALDDAGFHQVPIWTNDLEDYHDLHPGLKLSLSSAAKLAFGFPMMDALEALLRMIRPYETVPGSTDKAFETALDQLLDGIRKGGVLGARAGFARAIDTMKTVDYDRSVRKPTVVIVGEYLLNFHPGANHDIENYLEKNGFEIIEARMSDVIQKSYFYQQQQMKAYHVHRSLPDRAYLETANRLFDMAHHMTNAIASAHPLYEPAPMLKELSASSDPIFHSSFDTGEGILIPAEIIHHARNGCRNFVILQPFGCLPGHIIGRGISGKLQEMFPEARILALDYDPDVSFANIENRLQMLINDEKLLRDQGC